MKRREIIGTAIAAAALTACGEKSSGPAIQTKKKVRWNLASSFPRSLDTLFGGSQVLADHVEAMSGGNFKIKVYSGGELVPPFEVMDSVQQGSIQVAQTASYYFIGKNPALAFDSCVPFGMTSRQQSAWLHVGGGLELIRELLSDFNIIGFPGGNTGAQMGGWFKREVNSLAEMKGLRMRIPGMGGKAMAQLGVSVQNIPGGEIYTALERGAIDATEWVGPYDDEQLGLHKVARYYYYPGWWEPGPSLSFYVNQAEWNKLPKEYQEIFTAAARVAEANMQARYDSLNPISLDRILKGGTEMRPFSQDIMDAAFQASQALLEDHASKDASYAKIYTAWKKARQDSFRWFKTTEATYASYAFSKF
ncbi:MAG: TRAP transporter substrate-binding protein [Myxococcota bacterium]|nr:TRAP transporter substrate-binding protein [Myxococcota bacterium]